jgi:hypothetical protein
MRGENTREKGGFCGEHYLEIRRLYWGILEGIIVFRRLEDCITGFGWRSLWKDCYKGAPVVGSLGLEGQEFLRNPGARELERLYS